VTKLSLKIRPHKKRIATTLSGVVLRGKKMIPPKSGYLILSLLASLTLKWLQIGTNMLLIITSTGDELFKSININDLERP